MMFKDTIILKKEQIDEPTIREGVQVFQTIMEKAFQKIIESNLNQNSQ
jgi:hypothetical protein